MITFELGNCALGIRLHSTTAVLAIGLREGKPAVYTQNSIYGQKWVWSKGKKSADCNMLDELFIHE